MPRKKKTEQDELPLSIPETVVPATPEGQAVLEALRSNLSLLGELAARYQVPSSRSGRRIGRRSTAPRTCTPCWGRRWAPWPRSSSGCCC